MIPGVITYTELQSFLSIKHQELNGKSEKTQRIVRESMERVVKYYEKQNVKPKQLEIWE